MAAPLVYCLSNSLYVSAAILAAVAPGFELELLIFDGNGGTRSNRLRNEGTRANHTAGPDDCFTAQNCSIGINRHIIFNSGMPLLAPQALAATGGKSA